MPEPGTVPARWLARQLGIEEGEVRSLAPRWLPLPDGEGNYETNRAIEGAFSWLRHERDFIEGKEIAALLEVSTPRVSNMTRDGIIGQDGKGRYERPKTLHDLFRYFRTRIGEGKTTAAQAKQEHLQLQTQILRIAVAKAQGEVFSKSSVERALAHLVFLARGKFLRLANKIAGRIMYLTDPIAIEAEVQKEIEEALAELARPVEYEPDMNDPDLTVAK